MNREQDYNQNYFEGLPTAYYDGVFKNGKFIDVETQEEIKLKDGARVRIQTLRSAVLESDYEAHIKKREQKLICLLYTSPSPRD